MAPLSIEKMMQYLISTLFFIFCFTFAFQPVETGDIWWHLKAGEYIWSHGQVPVLDPFPGIWEATPWIYTQWLGGLFYFLLYDFAGAAGLVIFRACFFTVLIALSFWHGCKHIPFALHLGLLICLLFAFQTRMLLRPFIFNFLAVSVFFIFLFKHHESKKIKDLLPLLGIGLIWTNLHLGAFIYGSILIGLFWLESLIYWIASMQKNSDIKDKTTQYFAACKQLSLLAVGFALILCCTPYGIEGALHGPKTLLFPDYLSFGKLNKSIQELLPPQHLFSWNNFWFSVFLMLGISVISRKSSKRLLYFMLWGVSLSMFLYARRGNIFFCLTTLFIFYDFVKDSRVLQTKRVKQLNHIILWSLPLFLIFGFSKTIHGWAYLDGRYVKRLEIHEDKHNLQQMKFFLEEHSITGPILNDDRYGAYLHFHFNDDIIPFIDSRQLNYAIYDLYHALRRDPEAIWPQLAKQIPFQAILFDSSKTINRKLIQFFYHHPDWQLAQVVRSQLLFLPKKTVFKEIKEKTPLIKTVPKKLFYHEAVDSAFSYIVLDGMPQAYKILLDGKNTGMSPKMKRLELYLENQLSKKIDE